jgi:nuclear receptor interaction protein
VQILHADDDTTNVAVGHPTHPLLAVSGIDYTIKLFSPDRAAQHAFGLSATEQNTGHSNSAIYSGKASRRKLHEQHRITSQNEVMSENGLPGTVFTVSLSFGEWAGLWRDG